MFLRIDHIGVAVRNLEEAADRLQKLLGLRLAEQERVEEQQLIAALIPTDDVRFELMQPTSPDSVVGRFLERRGEGIHHICFEVGDIVAEIGTLKGREVQLIQGAPRQGFVGLVEFIHPRAAAGVLVEMAQVSLRTPASTGLRLGAVSIATAKGDAAALLWKRNFGMVEQGHEARPGGPGDSFKATRLSTPNREGRAVVEFLEPAHPQSVIAEFIKARGEGVYSLTLVAQSLEAIPYRSQVPGSAVIPP
ncbi:MAG: methylmalonyl-CoA epimerase [Dehalococcoidia bacterium]|nr:methylmalonyl-CoA epimerase [Dehalococcoidia bacterium]